MLQSSISESPVTRSAAAMRINAGDRPWYLDATPIATLPWLIRIRWTSAILDAVVLAAAGAPRVEFPLAQVWPFVTAAGAANAVVAIWLSRRAALPYWLAAVGLWTDALLLAALLELTGGPFNPFAVVLAAYVALAGLTLGSGYAAATGVLAAGSYCVLIYRHIHELVPGHHRLADFPTHLFTMWVAAAIVAELAAYFVAQASTALARREEELDAMRQQAARTDHIVSLTTLAAGAAHELSTPLATIAVAARELEHAASAGAPSDDLADDARLIRQEVDRCQAILDQMSGRAGGRAEDRPQPIDLAALIAGEASKLAPHEAARLRLRFGTLSAVRLPHTPLAQTVHSLVRNAFDASSGEVVLFAECRDHRLRLVIQDDGPGMPAAVLKRAGEPFFTTKDPGRGLGLGLFLARVFAERCGGTLAIESSVGTTVTLDLPVEDTRSTIS
jgi:two-component system sensor histidine kinase RegB